MCVCLYIRTYHGKVPIIMPFKSTARNRENEKNKKVLCLDI